MRLQKAQGSKGPGTQPTSPSARCPTFMAKPNDGRRNEDFSKQGMGVEACVSEDAGHYLCDFVYFKSLHSMCGKSLFVHVPEVGEGKPYSIQQMSRGLSVIIKNIISQMEK